MIIGQYARFLSLFHPSPKPYIGSAWGAARKLLVRDLVLNLWVALISETNKLPPKCMGLGASGAKLLDQFVENNDLQFEAD